MPNRGRFSDRTRASAVFDFMKRRALEEFQGDANIRALPKGQTVHFLFRNQILVRFKKANGAGIGSNIETQSVLEFVDPQLNIPDLLPEIYKVEICYHVNQLGTGISEIAVTARERKSKLWSYELQRDGGAEILELPIRKPVDIPAPVVRIRKRDDKEQIEE